MSASAQIEKAQAATANGPKTVYHVELIDEKTGKTIQKHTVTSKSQATYLKTHLEKSHKAQQAKANAMADNDNDGYPDSLQLPDDPQDSTASQSPAAKKAKRKPRAKPDPGSTKYQAGATLKPEPSTPPRRASINKQSVDHCGMDNDRKKAFLKLSKVKQAKVGLRGTSRRDKQSVIIRRKLPAEEYVGQGIDNNAFIVIGNDRVEKPHSGYGGKGHTQCDAIDLVAGLGGTCPQEVEKVDSLPDNMPPAERAQWRKTPQGFSRRKKHNPNFFVDAARIYISQKTDVDKNFGIGEFGPRDPKDQDRDPKDIGQYGAKSAIAVKADNVRIIGRESIRLVTGTDKYNSVNGQILGQTGIEIIAMNDVEKLQPMVLGDNLVELLSKLVDKVDSLAKVNHGYMKYQMKFNQAIQHHTHVSPFFGIPTLPSEILLSSGVQCDMEQTMNTEMSIVKALTNHTSLKMNYLQPSGGERKYICSQLNKCN